jgi:retron-type reverse transcriptase
MNLCPDVIIRWVTSFLQERTTIIKVFEGESELFDTETGIPQGSPVSPILFLFFIADLLDATNNITLRVSAIGFVDDIYILTYESLIERNYKILKNIYERCEV